MSDSPLVDYIKMSPNRNSPRNHKIDTITIHCTAGQTTVEALGSMFATSARQASSNYGIGKDGRIGMYVRESDRSWCSSSPSNDHRAITIEVSSDATPPYEVTPEAYEALIRLLADICQRNAIARLRWQADPKLVGQPDKQNLTVHRWFAAKACPGDWLYNRHGEIADRVNALLEQKKEEIVKRYQTTEEIAKAMPYAEQTIRKLIERGILTGKATGLDMSEDMIRMLVILDRANAFDR